MIIINIADIHGNAAPISEMESILSSADLILLSGDITHFGGEREASEIIHLIRTYNPNILGVSGNCDTKEVDSYLESENIQIHGRHVEINGISVLGAGGSLQCPGPTPNIYTENEYVEIFESSTLNLDKNAPKIMVSHQPPINTLNDRISDGAHVGSVTVREYIERIEPLVCFTGHIHEAPGIDEIGITKIVNPGPLGTRTYGYLEISNQIDTLEIRKI